MRKKAKRILATLQVMALLTLVLPPKLSFGLTGSGTQTNPYLISTAEDLAELRNGVNDGTLTATPNTYFEVKNNINLTNYLAANNNGGKGWVGIGTDANPFKGHFIGNAPSSATISGLWIDITNENSGVGLFGTATECEITGINITLDSKGITATSTLNDVCAGALVGVLSSSNSKIDNCSVSTGKVDAKSGPGVAYAGGLVGISLGGATITKCNIADVTVDVNGEDYTGGLIGQATSAAITNCSVDAEVISNIQDNTFITGNSYTGGLIGRITGNSTITNCHTQGDVESTNRSSTQFATVGGLVGLNDANCNISNCSSSSNQTISATSAGLPAYAGGFVGWNNGNITDCHAAGNITTTTANTAHAGGFVGRTQGPISKCFAKGNVSATSTAQNAFAGGFAAQNGFRSDQQARGPISNCYAHGNVTATTNTEYAYAGGFIGRNEYTVENCYSVGEVDATSTVLSDSALAGGFAGHVNDETYVRTTGCYFDEQTSELANGVGDTSNSDGIYPKSTAQMKQQATFDDWDYDTVWGIEENVTYPFLIPLNQKRPITYKNYDGKNLPPPQNPDIPTEFVVGKGVTLPTVPPYNFPGYNFLGYYSIPMDNTKREPIPGVGLQGETKIDVNQATNSKITRIFATQNEPVTLYAWFISNTFDEFTDKDNNTYMFAPDGVFPNGSTASMEVLPKGSPEYMEVETQNIEDIMIVNFTVKDSSGKEIQPLNFFGKLKLGFRLTPEFLNNPETLKTLHVVVDGQDIEYPYTIWQDPTNPIVGTNSYAQIEVDHLTPFAILDLNNASLSHLKPTQKTGDFKINFFKITFIILLIFAAIYYFLKKQSKPTV